jgi:hypothetical protein
MIIENNLIEDTLATSAAPNSIGGGGVEGIGFGPKGEPGVNNKKKKKLRDIIMFTTPLSRIGK